MTCHVVDPASEHGSFEAFHPPTRVLFGYQWKRADFPWISLWEENRSRTFAPWNGNAVTRGVEFGVSPFAEGRRAMVERGSLLGVPTYRWLGARQSATVHYSAFAATSSINMPQRNLAVDTYRGFVMLLMMAEVLQLSHVAQAHPGNWILHVLAYHQTHVDWAGCSLHDTIQPGFSFLVGVALPYSIASRLAKGGTFPKMFLPCPVAIAGADRARHLSSLHAQPADVLHV